ncbi:hypothetical protein [Paracoccus sp. (in: a-proteobacteria)]|uniref:hypothetical protein n=1 Tax=Paracoccus sp. TaxID=267 RepID=UPI003A83AE6F
MSGWKIFSQRASAPDIYIFSKSYRKGFREWRESAESRLALAAALFNMEASVRNIAGSIHVSRHRAT